MVFGTRVRTPAPGSPFRNPANGDPTPYGDYLVNAQGEDVVAGIRNTRSWRRWSDVQPRAWAELQEHLGTLEATTATCATSSSPSSRVAVAAADPGRQAHRLGRVDHGQRHAQRGPDRPGHRPPAPGANRLEELFKKVIAEGGGTEPIATGLERLPGAAVGKAVFSADDAQAWAERGEAVILVRRETTPDDYHGMIRSQGVLTSAGGTNSHAAVVARGEGIPAVCGADAIRVDRQAKRFSVDGTEVAEGDWVTIDGFTGKVYAGQLGLADSPIERARAGDPEARTEKIWQAYARFMGRADEVRRLKVRANADTPGQSANAIERGAEGIGLCRTEHMFLGEERWPRSGG